MSRKTIARSRSVAETIDADLGDTSHGPTRKLALSEPPSNASAEINAAWCDLVGGAETGLNRRSMTMPIKITLIFALAIAVTSAARAKNAFGQASISSTCPVYEGYPDCH